MTAKSLLTQLVLIVSTLSCYAQWQPVNSSSTDTGTIYHLNGRVGMGTSAVSANGILDVFGGGLGIGGGTGGTTDASLHIKTSYGSLDRLTQMHPSVAGKPALNLIGSTDGSMNFNWWSWGVLTSGSWALQPSPNFGGSTGLFINRSGYVGLGTTSPDQMLTVNGTIHSTEVRVDLSIPGPDYVFEKSYKLLSLKEIKSYIDQHNHLPEIPSAVEMEKNGVHLGEMNMLLLKKVEELTLYVLELKEEINELKKNQQTKK